MKSKIGNNKILIVTGLSGAGRTTALKILEDIGFEAIDNLPVFLLPNIIDAKIKNNLAVGIDIRSREFNVQKIVKLIKAKKTSNISIVFFDCDNLSLLNRYKESRRIHPLKLDLPISHIIDRERVWLDPLKKNCDFYLNTSDLSINLLRKQLILLFGGNKKKKTTVRIMSFGYKYGLPREADFVFDMRFIKNPFYVKELKKLNGKNSKVKKFVKNQEYFNYFFDTIDTFFENVLDGFKEEGKDFLTVAFGCTGGLHRSVVSSEYYYSLLKNKKNLDVFIDHRDLRK